MRSLFILFLALLATLQTSIASSLSELVKGVETLGAYEVTFEVSSDGESYRGSYIVDGVRYNLSVAGQTIYGDDRARYTIDNKYKEVVIEPIDSKISTIITNPVLAFSQLESNFIIESEVIMGGVVTLNLSPVDNSTPLSGAEVTIDQESKLPLSIKYIAEGESVSVVIDQIGSYSCELQPLRKIDLPKGYDIIDLR